MRNTELEQALFGYDDGHRLLQASTRLNPYERDLLLQLSDLAPGVGRLREDGYWTGMPLRDADRYALLRTWPAPEMPRPGCVWTHALLVPFEEVKSRWNLRSLLSCFRRPESAVRLENYARTIFIQDVKQPPDILRLPQLEQAVSCIYFSECRPSRDLSQDQLGAQSVAIWNQQVPELRTRLSFRTVERKFAGRSWLLNFDLMLHDGTLRVQPEIQQPSLLSQPGESDVASRLVEDLDHPSAEFAAFRDRYGDDLPLHPVWTAFLMQAQLRLIDICSQRNSSGYETLLEEVGDSLPNYAEGLRFKTALVSFSPDSAFDLQPQYGLTALIFQTLTERGGAFPHPNISDSNLDWLWIEERERLVRFLDDARKRQASLHIELARRLTERIDADQLFPALREYPDLLRSFVELRPEYLRWNGLATLSGHEIATLLKTLSDEDVQRLDVISSLITSRDAELSEFLCDRFASEVVYAVCASGWHAPEPARPNEVTLRFVERVAPQFLNHAFVSRLKTTGALLAFASMLGFINAATVAAGPRIWAESLHRAERNSFENEFHKLQAFALALGLATVKSGSEVLLAFGFENIHDAMKESRLDYQASVMLEPLLPKIAWWKRWDSCHRLRMAILHAYAYGDLPLNSFNALAMSSSLMGLLWHEVESHSEYRPLLDRLLREVSQFKNASERV